MADGLTNNYSIIQPQVGSDSGTWGGVLNNGVMGALDSILGGVYTATLTGSDVTLTTTQFQNGVFSLNGGLTGNRSLILPFNANSTTVAVGGKFVIVNNCTGSFNVTVKTAASGSVGVVAPQGQPVSLYSDTTNVGYGTLGTPATVSAVSGSPSGQLAGTAGSVNTNATLAADFTNGQLYLCAQSGTAANAVFVNVAGQPGFDTARNLTLSASVGANILTVTALAANTGTTPAVGSPIIIPFRNVTLTNGAPSQISVTSALSISTIVGATLGSQSSGVSFRFWIAAFNSAGTVYLSLINCSTATQIFPLNASALQSSTAMTSGATSAGVFYTPAAVTLANCPICILGYVEFTGGLVTAGTYNNPPTALELFGPGIKKPGDTVQVSYATTSTSISTSGGIPVATALSAAITPTSAQNLVSIEMTGYGSMQGSGANLSGQIYRGGGTVPLGQLVLTGIVPAGGPTNFGSIPLNHMDAPNSVSTQTYVLYINRSGGGVQNVTFNAGSMMVTEMMG